MALPHGPLGPDTAHLCVDVQRLFAEPPHMQASMLFVGASARVPEVGDEVEVRVRFTTTTFDRVVVS